MKVCRPALGALAFCSTLVVPASAVPVAAQAPSPSDVSWQSAGDSYSSGEGVLGNEGACAQSQAAYGPAAADLLRIRGWRITGETFTACTGHLVEDYFNARSGSSQSLWDWGREQGGPGRVDVITMSFGGNDIGFADVIVGCVVGLPDSWGDFLNKPACDAEDELTARIDALLDPPRRNCTGLRSGGGGAFDCDLDLGDRRGSIIDFYHDVVNQRLTERGRLVIVGYPRIFADVNQWPGWVQVSCEMVKRGDAEKLGRVAEHLNNKLQEAVRRANEALGSERVLFVDRFAAYRDGLHELCGTNDDWLNGLLFSRGQGYEIRRESSFHPNYEGHEGIAPLVADRLYGAFPRASADPLELLRSAEVPSMCGHPPGRLVNGERVDLDENEGFEYLSFDAGRSPIVADLDGDGSTEVVAVIDCNAGGVGHPNVVLLYRVGPTSLTFLDEFQIADVADSLVPDYAGDRSGLREWRRDGVRIASDWVVHRPDDFGCCPTLPLRVVIDVNGGQLSVAELTRNDETTLVDQAIARANSGDETGLAALPVGPYVAADMVYVVRQEGPISGYECSSGENLDHSRTCLLRHARGGTSYLYVDYDYEGTWSLEEFESYWLYGD